MKLSSKNKTFLIWASAIASILFMLLWIWLKYTPSLAEWVREKQNISGKWLVNPPPLPPDDLPWLLEKMVTSRQATLPLIEQAWPRLAFTLEPNNVLAINSRLEEDGSIDHDLVLSYKALMIIPIDQNYKHPLNSYVQKNLKIAETTIDVFKISRVIEIDTLRHLKNLKDLQNIDGGFSYVKGGKSELICSLEIAELLQYVRENEMSMRTKILINLGKYLESKLNTHKKGDMTPYTESKYIYTMLEKYNINYEEFDLIGYEKRMLEQLSVADFNKIEDREWRLLVYQLTANKKFLSNYENKVVFPWRPSNKDIEMANKISAIEEMRYYNSRPRSGRGMPFPK